ncbi:hypothetical protein SB778_45685, partial [Paraburkholderia sp. SIMBA_050]
AALWSRPRAPRPVACAPLRDLDSGKIAIGYDGTDYYMPLADGSVLHARPIQPFDLDIKIYAYLLLALAALFAVVLWISY